MDKIGKVNRDACKDKQRLTYYGVKVVVVVVSSKKKKRNNERAGLKIGS